MKLRPSGREQQLIHRRQERGHDAHHGCKDNQIAAREQNSAQARVAWNEVLAASGLSAEGTQLRRIHCVWTHPGRSAHLKHGATCYPSPEQFTPSPTRQ
jgi:hypothetical protein